MDVIRPFIPMLGAITEKALSSLREELEQEERRRREEAE